MSVREVSPFPLSEGQALEYPAAIVWHSPDNLLSFWMGQTFFLCKSLWRDEWYAKWNRRKKILLICIIIAGERGMPTLCQCSELGTAARPKVTIFFIWLSFMSFNDWLRINSPARFWGLMSGFLKQKERCGHLKNLATTSNVSLNQAKTLILMSARVLLKTISVSVLFLWPSSDKLIHFKELSLFLRNFFFGAYNFIHYSSIGGGLKKKL